MLAQVQHWGEYCFFCGEYIKFTTSLENGQFIDDYSDEKNHGPSICEVIPEEFIEIVSVSLGVGLQSTLILIMMLNKHPKLEQYWSKPWFTVFSDTMGEQDATYSYLKNILIPYAAKFDKNIIIIKRDNGLLNEFWENNKIPMGWVNPSCSSWSKRNNIYQFYRSRFGIYNKSGKKYLSYRNLKIYELIGFTLDEFTRVKPAKQKWIERCFPLIELNLSRNQLPKIYQEYNLPIASKSGCWYCPNAGKKAFLALKKDNPMRFSILKSMEEHAARKYEKAPTFLVSSSLIDLKIIESEQLEDWFGSNVDDQMCGESSCMT